MPGMMLDAGDTAMDTIDVVPALMELLLACKR